MKFEIVYIVLVLMKRLAVSSPTAAPTATPTMHCSPGSFYDAESLDCSPCPIGHYSNVSSPPFPASCALCEVGQYNTAIGLSHCLTCPVGKLSSLDHSYCDDCESGKYVSNNTCIACEPGKYAPSALSESCIVCKAGSYTNNVTKATTCVSCDGGKYSSISSSECISCSQGKFSSSGASSCLDCSFGFFTDQTGSSSCTACSAGRYVGKTGARNCSSCDLGKYQGSTGQSLCEDCDAGKHAQSHGLSSCSSCATGLTSSPGAVMCDNAEEGYYLIFPERISSICPGHSYCIGGNSTPIPRKGYWVDHSRSRYISQIYKCPRSTCNGGTPSACWQIYQFNSSRCSDGMIQCRDGAQGPLCGSCVVGRIYHSSIQACIDCETAQANSWMSLVCLLVVSLLVLASLIMRDNEFIKNSSICRILWQIDGGRYKALWVTYQITASTSYTLDIKFPVPFRHLLGYMSIFSLDFLSIDCADQSNESSYFRTLFLWCFIPMILVFAIVATGVIRWLVSLIFSDRLAEGPTQKRTNIVNQHAWLFLFFSYIVLPPVVYRQLQFFDCLTLESGQQYIRSDTSVDCSSQEYIDFQPLLLCFIVSYQLVPVLWLVALVRHRAALNPPTSNDQYLALFIRDNNPDLAYIRFLFVDYKCSKWWFEIFNIYRRLLFIAVLPLISPCSSARASFGCLLALISALCLRESQPFRVRFSNILAHFAQYCILFTYYGAVAIETRYLDSLGLKGHSLGICLVGVNVALVLFTLIFACSKFLSKKRKEELLDFKAKNYEDARDFSANKFTTTFEAIRLHSIPSSDALVFHYTSFEFADSFRKSGIPSQVKFGGVPLTLRPPHASTDAEFEVFEYGEVKTLGSRVYPNEEMFALSIPRQFLEPLPGFESDTGLCMVSTTTLNALRPSTFSSVLDERPWLEKFTLLPPQRILRSFLILDINRTRRRKSFVKSTQISSKSGPLRRTSSWTNKLELDNGYGRMEFVKDKPLSHKIDIVNLDSISSWGQSMDKIRLVARQHDLIPLYHYTSSFVVPMVLRGGLRMSSIGQGDGGVYLSTLGPASYGLGTDDYEVAVIKDCFGIERVEEYVGKGNLDMVIIYGCSACVLHQAPGGRDNARMVAKSTFEAFSMAQDERNYFLRPDRVLGGFYVNPRKPPKNTAKSEATLQTEKLNDLAEVEKLELAELRLRKNAARIESNMAHARWAYTSKMDPSMSPQPSRDKSANMKRPFWKSKSTIGERTGDPMTSRKGFWNSKSTVRDSSRTRSTRSFEGPTEGKPLRNEKAVGFEVQLFNSDESVAGTASNNQARELDPSSSSLSVEETEFPCLLSDRQLSSSKHLDEEVITSDESCCSDRLIGSSTIPFVEPGVLGTGAFSGKSFNNGYPENTERVTNQSEDVEPLEVHTGERTLLPSPPHLSRKSSQRSGRKVVSSSKKGPLSENSTDVRQRPSKQKVFAASERAKVVKPSEKADATGLAPRPQKYDEV